MGIHFGSRQPANPQLMLANKEIAELKEQLKHSNDDYHASVEIAREALVSSAELKELLKRERAAYEFANKVCVKLGRYLEEERDWVDALQKDNRYLINEIDKIASALGIKDRKDNTCLVGIIARLIARLVKLEPKKGTRMMNCCACGLPHFCELAENELGEPEMEPCLTCEGRGWRRASTCLKYEADENSDCYNCGESIRSHKNFGEPEECLDFKPNREDGGCGTCGADHPEEDEEIKYCNADGPHKVPEARCQKNFGHKGRHKWGSLSWRVPKVKGGK